MEEVGTRGQGRLIGEGRGMMGRERNGDNSLQHLLTNSLSVSVYARKQPLKWSWWLPVEYRQRVITKD